MTFPYAVAVVLDLEFGDRLSELAARLPVWIVDTPANRRAAQRHWVEHPGLSHTEGVTTFKVDLSSSAEVWCAEVLSDIDLHHGEYSHDPAYGAVEVFGATLTAALQQTFKGYGMAEFVERPGGFVATRGAAAA